MATTVEGPNPKIDFGECPLGVPEIEMWGDVIRDLGLGHFMNLGDHGHHVRIRSASGPIYCISGTASDFFNKFLGLHPDKQEEFCHELVKRHLFWVGSAASISLNPKRAIITRLLDGQDGSISLYISR